LIDPISSIEVATARLTLPAPLRLGPVVIPSREYAAVRVTTGSGLVGSAYCLTREAPVDACVTRLVAPVLLGTDSADPEAAWRRAFRATVFSGRVGLVVRAIGLVDIALWDIAAQRARVPLWQLLSGSPQPVPAMIVAAYPLTDRSPESLADDVLRHADAGYRLLKVARDPDPARMRRLLDRVNAQLPAAASIVVDAGFGWEAASTALDEVAGWGGHPLAWLEDPLVPEDVEGYAELRRRSACPIGVGDELSSRASFRALVAAEALDVLRLDVVAIGGVTPAREVLELAASHSLAVSHHIYAETSIHLAMAAGGTVETFERGVPGGNPLDPVDSLIVGGPVFTEGTAVASTRPGLGFELDWEQFTYSKEL
jgi:L-alanine-DL-glutamate epimerase-like enolase superfamily enzyme